MRYGFDWFIETLPEVVELVAQAREKGRQEGIIIGRLSTDVLTAVQTRYPALQNLAGKYINIERNPEELSQMLQAINEASSEDAVIQLLLEKIPVKPILYSLHFQWSERDQAYLVNVPELPGCHTDGDTYQEALENALNAIELWIEEAKKEGRPVPPPNISAWKLEKAEGM